MQDGAEFLFRRSNCPLSAKRGKATEEAAIHGHGSLGQSAEQDMKLSANSRVSSSLPSWFVLELGVAGDATLYTLWFTADGG
jgi:hypothetical protein